MIANNARISDSNNGAAVAATASTTVNSGHQLTLNKTAPSTIQAGQVLNYSIAWSVTGNEPAPTVVITDAVPANTTYAELRRRDLLDGRRRGDVEPGQSRAGQLGDGDVGGDGDQPAAERDGDHQHGAHL